jgi:glutathionylspermidine synthase
VNTLQPWPTYAAYDAAWQCVANAGWGDLNLDVWAAGRRYLSLATLCLTPDEAAGLRRLATELTPLLDLAVDRILADPDWWPALAWPWPAIELARQEPPDPAGACTLFGRFDCLLDQQGGWQAIEYNADTPSGGREAAGLEPAIVGLLRAEHGVR